MEKKDESLENFKKAITSTVKSIIGNPNIDVRFGKEIAQKNVNIIIVVFNGTLPLFQVFQNGVFLKFVRCSKSVPKKFESVPKWNLGVPKMYKIHNE